MKRFIKGIELAAFLPLQSLGLAQKEGLELILEPRLEESSSQTYTPNLDGFSNELPFQDISEANRADVGARIGSNN
ncbi:hypothetical protein D9M70_511450 [compost metagenome]